MTPTALPVPLLGWVSDETPDTAGSNAHTPSPSAASNGETAASRALDRTNATWDWG